MFWKRITLLKILGFAVRVDVSWFFLALLVTWSLAAGLFPSVYANLGTATYWTMGAIGAIGLFLSILFHEFSHSLVARHYDIPIEGITLFIFGGVAEMTAEPKTPKAELRMAIAGPLASLFLSAVFLALNYLALAGGWPVPVVGIFYYLGWVNGLLAVFNLVPAFPLDGGRVLRAHLWGKWNDFQRATRSASTIGNRFGLAFMIGAGFLLITGNIIGAIWWFLIGQFIRTASSASFQQAVIRRALEGEPVRRFMKLELISVPPTATIRELVDNFVYRYHHKLYPVVEDGRLAGVVGIADIKRIDQNDWGAKLVREIMQPCTEENTIRADADAMEALTRMRSKRLSRLLVMSETGQLAGILTLKDMLELFALKLDLESGATQR